MISTGGRRHPGACVAAIVLLVAAVAGAGACGGSDNSKKSDAAAATTAPAPSTSATPDPSTGSSAPAAGAAGAASDNWPTYGHDVRRTGVAASGPPNPAALKQRWSTDDLDGDVYAQPVVADNNVIVATEGDSVYAFDAATGRQAWRTNVGTPMRRADLPCGNIDPTGITGTPVVDSGSHTVYAVAFTQPGRFDLVALDLATGAVRFRRDVTPPGDNPKALQERGALTVANGRVYIPFGGLFGDCGNYHGWVVSAPLGDAGGALQTFQVPTHREGAIWAPGGPVVDDQGNVFVTTGNAESTSTFDYGNSVVRLTGDLKLADFWAPADFAARSRADADMGSIGPVLLDGGLVFQTGKVGDGFLLRAANLGRIGGEASTGKVCSGAFGTAAYRSAMLFVPCSNGLVALRVVTSPPSFSVAWRGPQGVAGPPVVAGDTVWFLAPNSGELVGLAVGDGHEVTRVRVGTLPTRFAALSAAGGQLFVPAGRRVLSFGS